MREFRILELFSGIGGMHYAFKRAELPGFVVAAIDINPVANAVYIHNHFCTKVLNNNIQKLQVKDLDKLNINMLVMSPPCQPHTRIGKKLDINDHRSDALQHLCDLIPKCKNIKYVLMENVKGFEMSQAHQHFMMSLKNSDYFIREFILSPTQLNVPNTRYRYYCLARKTNDFPFDGDKIWQVLPTMQQPQQQQQQEQRQKQNMKIQELLENNETITDDFYLPEKVLSRYIWLIDIVNADATNTMCFTKSYTHYSEGTGSVYTPLCTDDLKNIFKQVQHLEQQNNDKINNDENNDNDNDKSDTYNTTRMELLKKLRLRYFTPREVARLMSFPDVDFNFPTETTKRQKYRLLGNSINVAVVAELLKLLTHQHEAT